MVYITVRYGESEQAIFNPNCKTFLLLKNIRQKCKCGRETEIELSDESGNIKNLRDPGFQNRYANEFLDEREKLVLLKVERQHAETGNVAYTPMLQGGDTILSEEFLSRLAIKGSEQSDNRRAKSNTRRREKQQQLEASGKENSHPSRQSSRERSEKGKNEAKGKRLSAKSKK